MKKKFLTIGCLALSGVFMFASCSGSNNEDPSIDVGGTEEADVLYDVTYTGKDIIQNDNSSYQILLPRNATSLESFASTELRDFLQESTGVELKIITDDQDVSGEKYISLGATDLAAENGVVVTYSELGSDGFVIETKGDNLFIVGGSEYGTLYGVYGFLENEINWDYFTADLYTLDKVATLPLNEYHVKDMPDIATRVANAGFQSKNSTMANRMRVRNYRELIIPVDGAIWHNSFNYLPISSYGADGTVEQHPEWYASDLSQLCYTAGGDEASLARMQEIVTNMMYEAFMDVTQSTKTKIVMAIQDTFTACTCAECSSLLATYGTNSASIIIMLNKVAEDLETKLRAAGDWRADEFQIVFYAYNEYRLAPVAKSTDAEGNETFRAVDDKVVMNEHLCPYFCIYRDMDNTRPLTENVDSNLMYYDALRGWSALATGGIHIWAYDTNFGSFMVPYNTYGSKQNFISTLKESGVVQLFVQSQEPQQSESTAFHNLKYYLDAKLSWDTTLDVDRLINKFFNAAYGSQAEEVYEVFMEIRAHMAYLLESDSVSAYVGGAGNTLYAKYYSKSLLQRWLDKMENSIAVMKANGENSHYLETESIFPLFTLITLYDYTIEDDQLKEYRQTCADRMRASGITYVAETNGNANDVFAQWGVS